MRRRRARITDRRIAGDGYAVATVIGGGSQYRREVCAECPWRKDRPVGVFPAEAYRHSAGTSYDAAMTVFACHMSGSDAPQTCAGFLLSYGAEHNLMVRMRSADGRIKLDQVRVTAPTYRTYREMAEANGVPADDPALALCRDPEE